MSLIDLARDALKELPMSDLLRERLAMTVDLAAQLETKMEILRTENADLKAELKNERLHHEQAKQELKRLEDQHAEERRVAGGIEFLRGRRTGGQWLPFCPVCHVPVDLSSGLARCGDGDCSWQILAGDQQVAELVAAL